MVCASQLWYQTHCLVFWFSKFFIFYFTKTFIVKEAVHKQACSWLVEDQVHPNKPLWMAHCNPCKPGLRRRAFLVASSCACL